MKNKKILVLAALLILSSFFVVGTASARTLTLPDQPADANENHEQARQKAEALLQQQKEQSQQKLAEMKQQLEQKRKEHRLEICAKVGEHTKHRYTSIEERINKINARLTARVDRAKAFVTEKNLVVENYDGLLSDIAAKRQAAEATAVAVKDAADGFDCSSENGKAQAATIKSKAAEFKTAAKAYKASVRVFLTAVKTAAQAQLQSESVSQNSGGNQ